MIQQLHLSDFQKLFTGNIHNYGKHTYRFTKKGQKEEGSNLTVTNQLITIEDYRAHLQGEKGLGVIPINEENKCKFSVIDIDIYDQDLSMYLNAIDRNNFPLVPFITKSGGLHLYIFYKTFISAKEAIESMRKLASLLALDILYKNVHNRTLEIFPKQYKLAKGSIGTWLNLPYYNANTTKQVVIKDGKALSLEDALLYIKEKIVTLTDVKDFINELPFKDAPPCLQSMFILNPLKANTGRNDYILAFGTYLKKKDENFFEQALFEIDVSLESPLGSEELERTVLKSLRKKDYSYKCTQTPIVDYCNKNVCKRREFGVGKEGGYFSSLDYGQMFQIKTAQPYYEWEIKSQEQDEFKRLRFRNEDEIIKQDTFLKLCFRELHDLPVKMKQIEWFKLVRQYVVDIKVIEVKEEDDMSPMSLFKNIFFEFLLNRSPAKTKDQILLKRVYHDINNDTRYFRSKDFIEFLYINKNFRFYAPTEIYGLLRDMKINTERIRTESNKQIRVLALASIHINQEIKMENSINFEPDFNTDEGEF